MGLISATTAIIAGTATVGQIALVGSAVVGAGAVGQAYAANKAAGQQQKMANIQNARERKMALRSMRMQQRALEAQGVASGTAGGSGIAGAMGATASSTAGAIGYQGSMLANAQQITHWNNMATGFGALQSVGNTMLNNPSMFNKYKSPSPASSAGIAKPPSPIAATTNTGSNFAGYA